MIPITSPADLEDLLPVIQEIIRRAVDGTTLPLFIDPYNMRVGIGTRSPAYSLDVTGTGQFRADLNLGGALTVSGQSGPAVSPAGKAVLYYDTTASALMISQSGSAYAAIATGSSSAAVDKTARMIAMLRG